ncbi:MAG: hypothetical protein ABSF24_01740 [Candidatus Bathyarchaeia archaeon]|jgi:hypothetical protein
MFIGEVLAAYANKGAFRDIYDMEIVRMLLELGGNKFAVLDRKVIMFQS